MRVLTHLARAVRGRLRDTVQDICDPFAPPPDLEVLPCDWVASGNAFRRMLGYPPYTGAARYPTIEEMEEWERAFPGMAQTFRRCARLEAEIRWLRSCRDRP